MQLEDFINIILKSFYKLYNLHCSPGVQIFPRQLQETHWSRLEDIDLASVVNRCYLQVFKHALYMVSAWGYRTRIQWPATVLLTTHCKHNQVIQSITWQFYDGNLKKKSKLFGTPDQRMAVIPLQDISILISLYG
jgi:hypothetical protein